MTKNPKAKLLSDFFISPYRISVFLVDDDDGIFPCPKTNLFGVLHGMGAMFLVDALLQRLGVVTLAADMVENKVEAGLVEGDGVGGGQNADVLDARCGRVSVAVAVYLLIRFKCL